MEGYNVLKVGYNRKAEKALCLQAGSEEQLSLAETNTAGLVRLIASVYQAPFALLYLTKSEGHMALVAQLEQSPFTKRPPGLPAMHLRLPKQAHLFSNIR